jgi:hypothetical protein
MKLGPNTKVHELLSAYPFIKDYLVKLHPHFKKLNNPVMLQTFGRVATLHKAADAVDIPVNNFVSGISEEIKNKTGETVEQEIDKP